MYSLSLENNKKINNNTDDKNKKMDLIEKNINTFNTIELNIKEEVIVDETIYKSHEFTMPKLVRQKAFYYENSADLL
tara:strand:+ start:70 stop:300 length:231 start_codon:yes stop_codon:yes gene_type:complete